jgi:hypothetical protein
MRVRSLMVITAASMLLLSAQDALAQDSPQLQTGDRVRVTTLLQVMPARLVAMDATAITISRSPADTVVVPWANIRRLDVSAGRGSRSANAAQAGLIGLVLGAGIGYVIGSADKGTGIYEGMDFSVFGAAAFGITGGTLGLIFGAAGSPEKWQRVARPTF